MAGKANEDRLQDAFQYVRKTFFPRWDKKGKWRVVYLPEFKKRDEQQMAENLKRQGFMKLSVILFSGNKKSPWPLGPWGLKEIS